MTVPDMIPDGRLASNVALGAVLLSLLVVLAAGLSAGLPADGSEATTTELQSEEETTFVATSQGGFVAFSQSGESAARESGVAFPDGGEGETPIQIRGVVNDDNTWESTETRFPALDVTDSLTAEVTAPDGLSGEIYPDENRMTVTGTLNVTINDEQFSFDIEATTEQSNELAGSADFGTEPGTATIVDNEFLVSDQTGGVIDRALDLPAETEGENWFELPVTVDFEGDQLEETDEQETETDTEKESTTDTVLTLLGQGTGAVGVLGAVLSIAFFLVTRVTGADS